jgi:four helix bundle protein
MNIAEGCGHNTVPDFARFLQNAMGSASELEYGLEVSQALHYLSADLYQDLNRDCVRVKKMLSSLIVSLRVPRCSGRNAD